MTLSHVVIWRHLVVFRAVPALAARIQAAGLSVKEFALATVEIEEALGRDPHGLGESRPDWSRIYHMYPVTVYYEVHDEPNVVFIHRLVYHAHRP